MSALLAAADLGYRVQGKSLLAEVALAVEPGEMVAVVGPNGSGKTTLLRLLSGVLAPAAGRVELGGSPLGSIPRAAVAKRLSYVPQNTWTEFEVSVFDAVALGRLPRVGPFRPLCAADFDAIHAALAQVDLAGFEGRTLPTLSGGERQRVFLARALAQEADLCLLDEPTTSLDVGHQLEVMDLLERLHRAGRTLVAAMHDLALVWERFPRTVLLDGGRLAADGPTREVLESAAAARAFRVELRAAADGALRVGRRRDIW